MLLISVKYLLKERCIPCQTWSLEVYTRTNVSVDNCGQVDYKVQYNDEKVIVELWVM